MRLRCRDCGHERLLPFSSTTAQADLALDGTADRARESAPADQRAMDRGPPDSGGSDAGAPLCGRSLADGFDQPGLASFWAQPFQATGTSIEEIDGYLGIRLAADTPGSLYAFYSTREKANVAGGWVTVHARQTPLSSGRAEMGLEVAGDVHSAQLVFTNGELLFIIRRVADNARLSEERKPFTAADQHWRIRDKAGQIVWETSADGATWNVQRAAAAPQPVDFGAAYLQLWAGTWQPESSPGEARFDDFAAALGPCAN